MHPDLSEFDSDELHKTEIMLQNGNNMHLYSCYNKKTVKRHFNWLKDNQLDGVFLHQFVVELEMWFNKCIINLARR